MAKGSFGKHRGTY